MTFFGLLLYTNPIHGQEAAENPELEVPKAHAPSLSEALYQTAQRLYQKSNYPDAIEAYLIAISHNPPPIAYKELALSYQFLGEYEEALAYMSYYKEVCIPKEKQRADTLIVQLNKQSEEKKLLLQQSTPDVVSSNKPPSSMLSLQHNIALGAIILGGAVGTYFQVQAYDSRISLNEQCGRIESRMICPDRLTQLRSDENTQLLFANLGWGLMTAGILGRSYLVLHHGSISISPSSVIFTGNF